MRAPYLERLIDHVDGGGSLDSHDNIPSDIRRDLVLESQIGRKSKKADMLITGPLYPPTIINVLPAQNGVTPAVTSPIRRLPSDNYIAIPRSREATVRKYCKWWIPTLAVSILWTSLGALVPACVIQ